ncbi:MAG: SDR family NAD(P)-dependent oxidoreductase [Myxococcota bacterium]
MRLAAEGASLFLTDISADGLKETVELAGRTASSAAKLETRVSDVSDEVQARTGVAACIERYGRLDTLCNNAGIIAWESADAMSFELWRRILSVNLDGTFLMTREALPHLLAARGALVNIGSTAGLAGLAYGAAYSASKGGIHAFTRAIAVEYAGRGRAIS